VRPRLPGGWASGGEAHERPRAVATVCASSECDREPDAVQRPRYGALGGLDIGVLASCLDYAPIRRIVMSPSLGVECLAGLSPVTVRVVPEIMSSPATRTRPAGVGHSQRCVVDRHHAGPG
jgi:hypothetical protein